MLTYGPNLLQIQSEAVANKPQEALIESIGLCVGDLPAALKEWASNGGTILSQSGKTALVLDPWSVAFELVASEPAGQTHLNISTTHPEGLINWYSSNLGGKPCLCTWDFSRSGLTYNTIDLLFQKIDSRKSRRPWGPIDHIGLLVGNLDQTYDTLTAKGVPFTVKPREFGSARIAFILDPCGILIELIELTKRVK
jgi:hypothetical protein